MESGVAHRHCLHGRSIDEESASETTHEELTDNKTNRLSVISSLLNSVPRRREAGKTLQLPFEVYHSRFEETLR